MALEEAQKDAKDEATKLSLQEEFGKQSLKLKEKERSLNDFIRQTNLPDERARVQVEGFGRSISTKAVYAAKNTEKGFTIGGNGGIINKKAYAKINVDDIPSMDETTFLKAKKKLEERGVTIIQNSEGDKYLSFMGAEAMTLSDGTAVIFQSHRTPSASAFYEEIIHITQIKRFGVINSTGDFTGYVEYLNREIEANEKLLKNAKAYKLTKFDVESVRENLGNYYKLLEDVNKNV